MAGQLFNLKRYFGSKPDGDGQPNSYQVDPNSMPPPQMPMQGGYPQGYPQQPPPQYVQPNQAYYQNQNDGMNFPSLVEGMPIPGGGTVTQQPMYPQQQPQMPMQQAQMPQQVAAQPAPPMAPQKREDLSMLTHFSQRLNVVITQAATESSRVKSAFIEPEQLLFGLLFDSSIFKIIQDLGSSAAAIQEEIKQNEKMGIAAGTPQFSETVKSLLNAANEDAKKRNEEFITPEHVLFAIVENGNTQAAQILAHNKVTKEAIEKRLTTDKPLMQTNQTSALEEYGIDITKKAKEGKLDPIVARDKEIERTMHILSRRTKNNPVLIGEPGVGKTAIVEGLAERIVSGQVPLDLKNKKIIGLDLTAIIAGASHRGEFEERIKKLIKELQLAKGEIILFIDEIHNLVGAGGGDGAMNASNILKPFLARGEIQLIGTTTIDEYRRYIEKDPALERRFQQVQVDEPSIEQAIEMLKVIRNKYEEFHHVKIPDDAIDNAVKLSKRYIGDRFLPDKAIDLIDEAASRIKLTAKEGQHPAVTKEDIEQIVASWTGIPVTKLTEKEGERLLNLEKLIHDRMIDQEGAVNAIGEAVRRGRAGLKSTNRPIGSFLFLGPTGVGKTELAKTLAEVLFGSETLMIRLDMSEYMEKHEVAKLIGAPPGYVGYEEGGQLTEAVRTKPYSVVLLDEIEKAHPDVFNILLQILDDGRLTDNKGRMISFKNTIIIATSNAGTSLIQSEDLTGTDNQVIHMGNKQGNSKKPPTKFEILAQKLLAELMKFFKPEILNRFDEIIVFKPLTREHMMAIAKINFKNTAKLLAEQKIGIEVSEAALRKIAEIGFDPVFGARPLRRAIQTEIENPISTQLIQRKYQEGDTIVVDYDAVKDTFTFVKKAPQAQGQQPNQPQPPQGMHPMQNNMPQPMQPHAPNAPQPQSSGMAQAIPAHPQQNPFVSFAQPVQPQVPPQQTPDLYAKINSTPQEFGNGMSQATQSNGSSPLPTSNTMSNGVAS